MAPAYALVVLVLQDAKVGSFRRQAVGVLKCLSVVGRRLTVGKIAEAISLDFNKHQRAWASVWFR